MHGLVLIAHIEWSWTASEYAAGKSAQVNCCCANMGTALYELVVEDRKGFIPFEDAAKRDRPLNLEIGPQTLFCFAPPMNRAVRTDLRASIAGLECSASILACLR